MGDKFFLMLKSPTYKFTTDKTSINNGSLQAYSSRNAHGFHGTIILILFSSFFPQHQSIIPQPIYITLSFHVTPLPRNQAAHQFLAGNGLPARNDRNILKALLG